MLGSLFRAATRRPPLATPVLKHLDTLELSIDPGYVRSWTVYDALREILQNALDAHDIGHKMTVTRHNDGRRIKIRNEGITISRACLLLGRTTKADALNQRGKFGEGLDLALLVLARLGYPVEVLSGDEVWTPFIETSTTYGTDVLKVAISKRPAFGNDVEVQVLGVKDSEWTVFQKRLINIEGLAGTKLGEGDFHASGENKLLTGYQHRGHLYSRGLEVSTLPPEYIYGYDIANIKLDRDRKMADPFSLKMSIAHIMRGLIGTEGFKIDDLYKLAEGKSGEAESLRSYYDGQGWYTRDDLSKALAAKFHDTHGVDSVPVTSWSETADVGHHGLRGVVVSSALRAIIECQEGNLEERKNNHGEKPKRTYTVDDLDPDERTNLEWATSLVDKAQKSIGIGGLLTEILGFSKPVIVDFQSDRLYGCVVGLEVRLARKILTDREETLATLVHEVAHLSPGALDGTKAHSSRIETLFARIITQLTQLT